MSVVDGAAHTQKDDVKSNRGSSENVAKVFLLFLCGVQLVLRSGVLTVLDLDKVDVTPSFAEVLRLVLSGVSGSTGQNYANLHHHYIQGDVLQSIAKAIRQSPSPIHFFKLKSHAGIIGNEHADTLAKKSANTYSDIADTSIRTAGPAGNPFYNIHWLTKKDTENQSQTLVISIQQTWPLLLPQGFGTYQTNMTPFKPTCIFYIN